MVLRELTLVEKRKRWSVIEDPGITGDGRRARSLGGDRNLDRHNAVSTAVAIRTGVSFFDLRILDSDRVIRGVQSLLGKLPSKNFLDFVLGESIYKEEVLCNRPAAVNRFCGVAGMCRGGISRGASGRGC